MVACGVVRQQLCIKLNRNKWYLYCYLFQLFTKSNLVRSKALLLFLAAVYWLMQFIAAGHTWWH